MVRKAKILNTLRLIRSKNLGPKTYLDLLSWYGSSQNIINNLPAISKRTGGRKIEIINSKEVEKEYEKTLALGGNFISLDDENYPKYLKQIDSPPIVLTYLGNIEILQTNDNIAIVGARNASINASILIHDIAKELGDNNLNIVSGLARGIDHAAHTGALDSRYAKTTAVLAGGIDVIKQQDIKLYDKIIATGLVLSEMPLACEPTGQFFPRRNRIISGLSNFVLLAEAGHKSGSIITANYAIEHGRELGVIPSFPADPRSLGGNNLIKNGANLISSAQDIIDIISNKPLISEKNESFDQIFAQKEIKKFQNEDILITLHEEIDYLLSFEPTSLDDLAEKLKTQIQYIRIVLIEKELAGTVKRLNFDKFVLLKHAKS